MPVSRIESGHTEVFDSGTVIAFGDESIAFTLEHEGTDATEVLELTVEFVDDGGEPHIEMAVDNPEAGARFRVHNHRSGDHVGPDEPFNIGIIGGRALHMMYYVDTIERDDGSIPVFGYTFYLGQEVDEEELVDDV